MNRPMIHIDENGACYVNRPSIQFHQITINKNRYTQINTIIDHSYVNRPMIYIDENEPAM